MQGGWRRKTLVALALLYSSAMNETVEILKKMMDASAVRQTVIANNIANANTPGFKRSEVSFNAALTEAIKSNNSAKIFEVQPKVSVDKASPSRPDGNNVLLQKEMGDMMENGLLYGVCTAAISKKYASLRRAIGGR